MDVERERLKTGRLRIFLRIFMTLIFAVGLGMFTMHIYYTQLGEKEVPKSLNTSEIETILLHIRDQSDQIRRLEQKVDDLEKLIKEKRTMGGGASRIPKHTISFTHGRRGNSASVVFLG